MQTDRQLELTKNNKMSDLAKYIARRKLKDHEFSRNYEAEYQEFTMKVILEMAREETGLIQEKLAQKV